jgi:hypothetical protein
VSVRELVEIGAVIFVFCELATIPIKINNIDNNFFMLYD